MRSSSIPIFPFILASHSTTGKLFLPPVKINRSCSLSWRFSGLYLCSAWLIAGFTMPCCCVIVSIVSLFRGLHSSRAFRICYLLCACTRTGLILRFGSCFVRCFVSFFACFWQGFLLVWCPFLAGPFFVCSTRSEFSVEFYILTEIADLN